MNAPFVISPVEKLAARHEVSTFKCGQHSLDLFLRKYALKNAMDDLAQTYIVHREQIVLGYYTLVYGTISRDEAATQIVAEITSPFPVPVMLLARWAVDKKEQRRGVGKALLKDAFLRTEQAADIGGLRAMLVDAIDDEMALYYQNLGFSVCPKDLRKLMISIGDIRANLLPRK